MISFKTLSGIALLLIVSIPVSADSWHVENMIMNNQGNQLKIQTKSIQLPAFNEVISNLNYICVGSKQIYPLHQCKQGNLSFDLQGVRYNLLVSGWLNLQKLTWNLTLENNTKSIKVNLDTKNKEQISIKLQQMDFVELASFFKPYLASNVSIPDGKINASMVLDFGKEIKLTVNYVLSNLNWESSDSHYVLAETFHKGQVAIEQKVDGIDLSVINHLTNGEGLFKDIYVLFDEFPVEIHSKIPLNSNFETEDVSVSLISTDIMSLDLVWSDWFKNKLNIDYQIEDFDRFYKGVLVSYLEINGIEDLSILGQSKGKLYLDNNQITGAELILDELYLEIESKKIAFENFKGYLNWKESGDWQESKFDWDNLLLAGMPVKQSEIMFKSVGQKIVVNENTSLPIFDGSIFINNLLLQDIFSPQISIDFDGDVRPVSLALITEKMGWPLMNGSISGKIPGMKKKGHRITFDGFLDLKVFDGDMQISDLSIERLFGIAPVIAADINFQNLNLQQITSTFDFGEITGLVEGYVKELRITNWKPDRLDAHINSIKTKGIKQTISQRAIDNISSIGGVQGALSRSFLGFFDYFKYRNIGFGCKLRNAICEMNGIKSNDNNYQLVEGRGLPNINIIGYRQFIDWEVFLDRLLNAGY